MEKKLPLKTPVISVYSNIANMQGILLNYEQGKMWVAQNFINYLAFYDEDFKEIKPHFFPISDIYLGGNYQMFAENNFFPLLRCHMIPVNMVNELGGLISFIKNSINEGYYICFFINRKYIRMSGQEDDLIHETFVYGYNDIEEKVYFCDYFRNSSYNEYQCGYDEIKNAFEFCDNYYIAEKRKIPIHSIMLVRYNGKQQSDLDIAFIKSAMKNYLDAVDLSGSIRLLHNSLNKNAKCYWGIDSYDGFVRYVTEWFDNYHMSSSRVVNHFQHLSDHKRSMKFTIKTLCEHGVLENEFIKKAEVIEIKSLIIRNKFIKYRIQGEWIEEKIINQMVDQIREVEELERELIPDLLHIL